MLRNRITILGAVLLIALMLPGVASAAVDAESVVSGKCTACHSAERIRESELTEDEWTDLVDEEIDRGAQLSRAERAAVVEWLTEKYGVSGSKVGEVVDVAQAEAEEEDVNTTAEVNDTAELPFERQADTGVELWQFLLTGGALISGGAWMRRR